MKIRNTIYVGIILAVLAYAFKAYAGQLSMTTYYPAPVGYYESLKVRSKFLLPCVKYSNLASVPKMWDSKFFFVAIAPDNTAGCN